MGYRVKILNIRDKYILKDILYEFQSSTINPKRTEKIYIYIKYTLQPSVILHFSKLIY